VKNHRPWNLLVSVAFIELVRASFNGDDHRRPTVRLASSSLRSPQTGNLPAMRVLITGGAGFIGSRLARNLSSAGHEVVLFDSLHPQVHAQPFAPDQGVVLYVADVRESAAWDRYILQYGAPEIIVHLAAETGTGQSLNEATRHGSANVVGTTELTDALVRHQVVPRQIILTSSRAVYGEGAWTDDSGSMWYPAPRSGAMLAASQWDPTSPAGLSGSPLAHRAADTWARPTNVYAATKLAQEHLLEAWCSSYGVPLSVLRLQNVYGPGQAVGNAYTGVLTFFARQIAAGEQVEVYEDGQIMRDFVFVDDVVAALARSIDLPPDSRRLVDIGGGGAVSLMQVAESMCAIGDASAPVINGRYRLGDVRAASADIDEASSDLSWKPEVALSDGLTALLDWVPSQL
jgi:dTDP-L-rhamnose 4-epimerase